MVKENILIYTVILINKLLDEVVIIISKVC